MVEDICGCAIFDFPYDFAYTCVEEDVLSLTNPKQRLAALSTSPVIRLTILKVLVRVDQRNLDST